MIAILVFINIDYVCTQSNISLTFSQTSIEDWKQGRRQSFEINSMLNYNYDFEIDTISFDFTTRLNLGYIMENGDRVQNDAVRPSMNAAFAELIVKYPIGWTLDPYISGSISTQITESFIAMQELRRTAKWWDPVTSQESIGFAYTYKKDKNKLTSRIGLSLKQIRADKHTMLTDDRMTRDIVEKYRSETGITFNLDGNINLSKSVFYNCRLDLFSRYEELDIWAIKFENQFNITLWKIFSIIVTANMYYDQNQSFNIQYNQSSRLGILTKI
jgi:hypothetical protein